MTSESLVASGDEKGWDEWHTKMKNRLALGFKIQMEAGVAIIVSQVPVFCTAAVSYDFDR